VEPTECNVKYALVYVVSRNVFNCFLKLFLPRANLGDFRVGELSLEVDRVAVRSSDLLLGAFSLLAAASDGFLGDDLSADDGDATVSAARPSSTTSGRALRRGPRARAPAALVLFLISVLVVPSPLPLLLPGDLSDDGGGDAAVPPRDLLRPLPAALPDDVRERAPAPLALVVLRPLYCYEKPIHTQKL